MAPGTALPAAQNLQVSPGEMVAQGTMRLGMAGVPIPVCVPVPNCAGTKHK